ncbi:nuclear transport factor 2 family protein [Catenuloplanes japonicus]|uniref:nuclear transport factor 2 family protein n=1 Tax=Catenuloplanes japonicus TaxID=33876 RepID=UPI0005268060|nr:nuclear transport factor 2 family protein [Catenuloplanes japonicus]
MSPRDIFTRLRQDWFGQPGPLTGDLLTDDVVMETPFAPPGHPSRIEGRDAWLAFANPARATFPIHIDGSEVTAIHDTADPATIIVEYTLTGTHAGTGRQATAPFIAVLTTRDGRISHWREYQNPLAMAQINA